MSYRFEKFSVLLTLILSLALFACLATADELKVYPCYRMVNEPFLDGRPNDNSWSNIPLAEGFVNLNTGAFSLKQTSFKLGHDNTALYLFIKCEEPHMDRIVAELGDMENIWKDDCVEIFLQPEGRKDEYYQFIINSIGSRWNGVFIDRKNTLTNLGNWNAAVYRGEDFWSIELKIPFTYLNNKDKVEWRANIARSIRTTQESTTWSTLRGGYHDIVNFGRIVFVEKNLTEGEALKIEKDINQLAHNSIEQDIDNIIKELNNWKSFFLEASKVQKNRSIDKVVNQIDALKVEDNSKLTISEKTRIFYRLKSLYNEAAKLRSNLLLEMLFFN